MRFKDRIVFITGGASGIGLSCAKEFLKEGAYVIINSRSKNKYKLLSSSLKKTSNSYEFINGDMSKESDVKRIFKHIKNKFKKIDIVINSAGISQNRKHNEISIKDWYLTIDNNITNTFLVCKHAIELMKKKKYGKIINISSVAGRNRSKLAGVHYSMAKSAVITLTRQIGAEVASYGINVNCLAPSQTNTEMLKPFLTPKNKEMLSNMIPIGRVAEPEEQAKVVLFLASEDASYMVGSIVDVNGGQI